jgi:hypothetical protein
MDQTKKAPIDPDEVNSFTKEAYVPPTAVDQGSVSSKTEGTTVNGILEAIYFDRYDKPMYAPGEEA